MRLAWIACVGLAGLIAAQDAAADARLDRALAEQTCASRDPKCDWLGTLSSLERASVTRAIAARGWVVDPSPWGKVIGAVLVYNEDVFAEGSRFLRFFNNFHVTTKERAIAQEVVIGAGEVWDQARVEETARRLRDPLWSSVVAVIPVVSKDPAKVDLLVVTRDIWSLRLNTQYQVQQRSLTDLSIALSENNFLGFRSVLAAAFTMNQGTVATGPLFIDKNLFGQHLDFRARVDAILNRDALIDDFDFVREGSQSSISLSRSLWSLASEWGYGASFSHRFAINRSFRGLELRTYDIPETAEVEALPHIYRIRAWSTGVYGVRQWGGGALKHQLTVGHSVDSQHPTLLGSFPGTDDQRGPFVRDVLPRDEVTSVPYLSYGFFEPRFKKQRNVQTFELAEDSRLGVDFDVSYGVGVRFLGSDDYFQRGGASLGYAFPLGEDGIVRPAVAFNVRYQGSEFIDNTASGTVRLITPTYLWGRIVALGTVQTRWNDTQNRFFAIGSDSGLRGFIIDEFFGDRLARAQVEVRSVPFPVWVLRAGGVLFYDVGSAADTFREMRLHHDVGIGFRMLIPQTSRELFRFDLAFPLDATDDTKAYRPRFIAGFEFGILMRWLIVAIVAVAVLVPGIAHAQYNVPSQASGERNSMQIAGAEVITLPEPLRFGGELGASLDFMTSDAGLGDKPLKFTDVVLFRIHGLVAIGKRVEVFAGADLLPKQPSGTDEHRWQGALAGARFVLPKDLSAYARAAFGPNLDHDGFWIAGESAAQYKRHLAENALFWESTLGLTYTQLLFDDRSSGRFFQTEILAQTGIAIREKRQGSFAIWLSFAFHFPLVHRPTEPVPDVPVRPTDPQVRVGMFLGTVLGVTNTLDLFAEFSILDRGDVEDPATTLPILSGGFDQRRILFGFNHRFGSRKRTR